MLKKLQGKENDRFISCEKGKEILEEAIKCMAIEFDVRAPVTVFTGRREELDKIHSKIQKSPERSTVITQATAISGLGGIGKTELARKYVSEYRKEYDYNVVWINAENEGTLTESFTRLAKDKLGISAKNIDGGRKTIKSIVEEVYKFFRQRKVLFVFDNVETSESLTKFMLMSSLHLDYRKPYILITSRNRKWNNQLEIIDLDVFKEEDAIEFVRKGLDLRDKSHDEQIKSLVQTLQFFPLAIKQAMAYIKNERVTGDFDIAKYLVSYEKKTKELLSYKIFRDIEDCYTETTITTWKITIDKITKDEEHGKLALQILRIMAYLASDDIKRRIFLKLAKNDAEKLKPAVSILVEYSMINSEQELSIHRLVQDVMRLNLRNEEIEETVLMEALDLLKDDKTNDFISHVASALSYASKYDKLIDIKYLTSYHFGYNSASPLYLLAEKGDHSAVEVILKRVKNSIVSHRIIDAQDKYGRTSLYIASENGHTKVVELLIANRANINLSTTYSSLSTQRNASDWTPLHIAAFNGHKDIVEMICREDQKLTQVVDTIGRTPAILAARTGQVETVKVLMPNNDLYLLHAMLRAERVGSSVSKDLNDFINILKDKNQLMNRINSKLDGWTPLQLAAFAGATNAAEVLINNGATVKVDDTFTPLHCASSNGHLEMVKLLLESGADPNDTNEDGWTSLHGAAQNGWLKVVKYFLSSENTKPIDVNISDKKGTTPLNTAAFHGKLNVVKFLLGEEINVKANIHAVDIIGETVLFSSAINNHREISEFLLKNGAEVNPDNTEKLLDKLQFSVLHLAAMYDDDNMVKYLIEDKGMDKDTGIDTSLTPLHVAAFFGSSKVIRYLIENGANAAAPIKFSKIKKALFDAQNNNKLQICSMSIIVEQIVRVSSYFADSIKLTPYDIHAIFKYPDHDELLDDFHRQISFPKKLTNWIAKNILKFRYLSQQINEVREYVNDRKDPESRHPAQREIEYQKPQYRNMRQRVLLSVLVCVCVCLGLYMWTVPGNFIFNDQNMA